MRIRTTLGILLLVALAGCKGGKKDPSFHTQVLGTVRYADGKPAPGATVLVDGFTLQAVTNAEGKYTLTGVPPGEQIIVAMRPGYRLAVKHGVNVPRSGRVTGVDMTIEPDPNYVPDAIKIENVSPPPDSVFAPGQRVSFSFTVRYHLTSANVGTIQVAIHDEKNNPLVIVPVSHKVSRPTDTINYTRQVTMPKRIKGEVCIVAILFPGFVQSSEIADRVSFKVRAYKDAVRFSTILLAPSKDDPQRVSLSVVLGYTLDSLSSGIVRLRVLGDKGKNDFATPVYETQQSVDKSQAVSGTLDFQADLTIPPDATTLKLTAELILPDSASSLFDVTSKVYPLKKKE